MIGRVLVANDSVRLTKFRTKSQQVLGAGIRPVPVRMPLAPRPLQAERVRIPRDVVGYAVAEKGGPLPLMSSPNEAIEKLDDTSPQAYRFYVFFNKDSPRVPLFGAAGHVGWGMRFSNRRKRGRYCTVGGSVENTTGSPQAAADEKATFRDFFETDEELIERFRNAEGYTSYLYVDVPLTEKEMFRHLGAALEMANHHARIPYQLLRTGKNSGANCLDDVHDVLKAGGVPKLPDPSRDYLPRDYVKRLLQNGWTEVKFPPK